MPNTNRNSARILAKLHDDVRRLKQDTEPEESVRVVRTITDEAETSDTVSAETQSAGSWDWTGEWGMNSW